MSFKLTNEQFTVLQDARDLFPDEPTVGNSLDYALLYDLILFIISDYQLTNSLSNEEAESVLWLEGARTVNRDEGAQSEFIRSYNDAQSQLRYGVGVTDDQMNQVSDEIVIKVIDDILANNSDSSISDIPLIQEIAEHDAGPAAVRLFQGDLNPAGWAGNPLFLFLNYGDAYHNNILHENQPGNTDTYDLLSVIKVTRALGLSNFEDLRDLVTASFDVAVQVQSAGVVVDAIAASEVYLNEAYGEDIFTVSSLLDTVFTSIVLGSNSDDTGSSEIVTTQYADIVHGGTGNDTILGSMKSDLIDGGLGIDTVDYAGNGSMVFVNIQGLTPPHNARYIGNVLKSISGVIGDTDALYNIEEIKGSQYDDVFSIKQIKDGITLDGAGGSGDDLTTFYLNSSTTFAVINGLLSVSSTTINFSNFEKFEGGNQNDTFIDASGKYTYRGKGGIDTVDYAAHDTDAGGIRVFANLSDGVVERNLIAGGGYEIDYVTDIEGIIGGSGNDVFRGKEGLSGTKFTGGGHMERGDLVDFSHYIVGGVDISLSGSGTDDFSGSYTLSGIEQAIGTHFDDTLTGSSSANWIYGGLGVDTINGGGGADIIIGGVGADVLNGGSGNDTYFYGNGEGVDTISDSSGSADRIYIAGGYNFSSTGFSEADGVFHVGGFASVDSVNDVEFVEFADGAKFTTERLTLSAADATSGVINGTVLEGNSGSNNLISTQGIDTVLGKGGGDWLTSHDDTVTLEGGSGEDYLFGQGILDGGLGNDFLSGSGNVTYKVSSGIDVILDASSAGNLTGAGGYDLWRASNDSLVIDFSSSKKVIVINHFNGNPLEFINGQAVPTSGVEFLPTEFDDFYVGGAGVDKYRAGIGDDAVNAKGGANTYTFSSSDTGSSTITASIDAQDDLMIFQGLSKNDVSAIRDLSIGARDLLLSYGSAYAVIEDGLSSAAAVNHYNFKFGSASAIAMSSLDLVTRGSYEGEIIIGDIAGFSDDDIIYGGAGDDIIYGGSGADILDGNDGNDTIETGDGSDRIVDSDGDDLYVVSLGDRIELNSGSDRIEFDDDKVASSGDTSNTFTLELPSFISSSDIVLTRDSTDPDYINVAYGGQDADVDAQTTPFLDFEGSAFAINEFTLTTHGTDGNDTIFDYFSGFTIEIQNDIIYGHGGDDGITVVNGGDDIVYGGAGNDSITQTQLFTPVTIGSVKFYGEEGDDTLTLLGSLSGELYGGSGNDTLVSFVNSDYLDGGTGDDLIYAGAGNDVIYGGDGDDTIIQLEGGIKTVYAEGGNDLIYLDIVNDDVIDGGEGLDSLSFEIISVLAPSVIDLGNQTATINSLVYTFTSIEGVFGTSADDTIIGNDENNILFGGNGDGVTFLGNDTLRGGAGDDIYFVGSSFEFKPLPSQPALPTPVIGSDLIDDSSGDADAIEFTDYYELADLTFSTVGNNLMISFAEGDITIQNHFGSGKVEELILDNGLVLDMDDYENWTVGDASNNTLVATSANEALYGGDGNDILTAHVGGGKLYGGNGIDTLTGDAGNDTLTGGTGDDILNGGAGDDTYVFNLGDGNNTITDVSGFDVLELGAGITLGDITFTQIGNDLDVQIASGFLIKDFYLGDSVEEIRFVDSTTFDLTTLLPPPSIDFNAYTISGYGGAQNESDTYVVEDGGATLNLSANTWEKIDFSYTVTADTILEFDFKSNSKGDVHGIGFVDNNSLNASQTFRVFGTQDFGINNMDTYNDNQGDWVHYTIDVGGYYTGAFSYLFFANDDDTSTPDAESFFRNVSIYENTAVPISVSPEIIDFAVSDFSSYTDQDKTTNIFDVTDRTELHIAGNSWKSMDFDYVVTGNTYVQLDYKTVVQGEIQGLVFLEQGSSSHSNSEIIRLDGSQNYSNSAAKLYTETAGMWQTITVKLSDYNTIGDQIDTLVFANDDDNGQTGEALFRDIRVFEDGTSGADTLNGAAFDETLFGRDGDDMLYGNDGDDILYGGSGVDTLSGGNGADTFVFEAASAFTNVDTITDFGTAESDAIDITDLLSGYDPLTDAISDFVQITDNGTDSVLSVDANGGADNFVQIATLLGVIGLTDEDALETSGNLIAA